MTPCEIYGMLTTICAFANLVYLIFFLCACIEYRVLAVLEATFNPFNIYEEYKVNVFGCTLITIFLNTLFILFAVIYWFCKLCTVGRRQNDYLQ